MNPSNFGAMRAAKFGVYRYPDRYMIVVPRGLFMESKTGRCVVIHYHALRAFLSIYSSLSSALSIGFNIKPLLWHDLGPRATVRTSAPIRCPSRTRTRQ
ncbi:hypothetical protein PILCRDRAFT_825356 [Piloderma croceum F 1598]|uniref:Uncharacterized protein n=1 Tax=Piloderma croceum (strain F 1598) TaxID=765440 RepID=A0A0C3ATY1_PILCF|nr:hypothetical protein PILCRDRAFT_825356 [Piloderma croceum F 1598]